MKAAIPTGSGAVESAGALLRLPCIPLVMGCLLLFVSSRCGATEAGGGDAHRQLDSIVHRPPYRAWRLQQDASLPDVDLQAKSVDRFTTRVGKWLEDLFEWLFRSKNRNAPSGPGASGGSAMPTVLKFVISAVAIIAVVSFIFIWVRSIRDGGSLATAANVLSRHQVDEALESGDALALGTAQWLDEARRLAAEQNFRAVYRALYLALLSGLHTAGKIEHSRNRTNWTYVDQFRGSADGRQTFSELTDLFDQVWYGRREPERPDLDGLQQKVRDLTLIGGNA